MYTKEEIEAFMQDVEAQKAADQPKWLEIREAMAVLYADKPVTLSKLRRELDALRRAARPFKTGRPAKVKPTVVRKDENRTYVCRICGVALQPTAKAVSEHYEKKHYSDYIRNKAAIQAMPLAFVK